MLVLDENLPARQRLLLRRWGIRFRRVGEDIAFSGAKDENLIPFLHRLHHPTFCSFDRTFAVERDLPTTLQQINDFIQEQFAQ
jgi:hypothetical protein